LLERLGFERITIFPVGTTVLRDGFRGGDGLPLRGASLPVTLSGQPCERQHARQYFDFGAFTSRVENGYLNINSFTAAPLLYPTQCDPVNNPNSVRTVGNLGRNVFRADRTSRMGLFADQNSG